MTASRCSMGRILLQAGASCSVGRSAAAADRLDHHPRALARRARRPTFLSAASPARRADVLARARRPGRHLVAWAHRRRTGGWWTARRGSLARAFLARLTCAGHALVVL